MPKYIDIDKFKHFVNVAKRNIEFEYGRGGPKAIFNAIAAFEEDAPTAEIVLEGSFFRCTVCNGIVTLSLKYAETVNYCPFCGSQFVNPFQDEKERQSFMEIFMKESDEENKKLEEKGKME